MSYSFFWTDRSRKDLEKLSPIISKRIVDKIESLSEDPHRTAERCNCCWDLNPLIISPFLRR